jgi:hypothetical protein
MFRKSWFNKPPAGVQMRRNLPEGASGLWLFNEVNGPNSGNRLHLINLARNTETAFTSAGGNFGLFAYGSRGLMMFHDATPDRTPLLMPADAAVLVPTQGITICLGIEKRDATNRTAGSFDMDNGDGGVPSNQFCGAFIPWSDGTVYWDFGGSTEDATRESAAGLDTQGYHTWAFTTGPRGMEIWQDGVLRSSNSANPTRVQGGLKRFNLGSHSNLGSDFVDYYFFFMHREQLPIDLIRDILLNPYGTLAEPRPRQFFMSGSESAAASGVVLGAQYQYRKRRV